MTTDDLQPGRAGNADRAMTTVYVDTRALLVGGAAGPDAARLAPDAGSALDHLREAGLQVVLFGGAYAITGLDAAAGRARLSELPEDPQGWMIGGDPAACARARPCRHLRTILVGSAAPARGLASRSCDVEARDLTDAALTILAAEAMDPARAAAAPDEARNAAAGRGTGGPAVAPRRA